MENRMPMVDTGSFSMETSGSEQQALLVKRSGHARQQSYPFYVYVLTAFAALGGFLFGYDTGVVSGAMLLIDKDFHLTSFWHELIVSGTIAACIPGAFCGGFLSQRFGRKTILLACSIVFTVGAVVMAVAHLKEILLVGRIIVGFGIGGASVSVPLYIAETAPSRIRGRLVTVNQLFIAGGQFIAGVVDGIFSSNKEIGWRLMLGMAAIPSAVMFFGCIILPESPRWLVSKGFYDQARKVLEKIRGTEDVSSELEDIKKVCEEEEAFSKEISSSSSRGVAYQMLTTSATRKALLVGCMLQAIQQLSGINTLMYYSATIIQMAGIESDQVAIWLAAVVAFINFLFSIFGVWLVERLGRRKLMLGSLAGCALCLFLIGGAFFSAQQNDTPISLREGTSLGISNNCPTSGTCLDCLHAECGFCFGEDDAHRYFNGSCIPINETTGGNVAAFGRCSRKEHQETQWAVVGCPYKYGWVAIVFLSMYLASFQPGLGPMPWTINAEIFPLWARGAGNAFATAVNWTCNLLISMSFLTLTEWITRYGAFWLYGAISVGGWVFFFFYLPETKGKSLEALEHLFS